MDNNLIKLVRPTFMSGKQKDFIRFMKNIGSGKIGLLSHISDLDGVASAKIIDFVVNPHFLKFVDYPDLNNNLIEEIKQKGITKLILSDLMIKDKNFIKGIESFAEVLIIDHHPFDVDYNSPRCVFINSKGYCAAYLSYYLFSKIKSIDFFDWLIVCASITDFQFKRNARWMRDVYKKYNQTLLINKGNVDKSSDFYKLSDDLSLAISYFKPKTERVFFSIGKGYGQIGDLENYSRAVKNEIDVMVNRFEREKIQIKDGWFFEFECIFPIKSYLVTNVSLNYKNSTLIIGEKKGDFYSFSARRQDNKKDMNELVKKLTKGFDDSTAGGHFAAAAGNFPVRYLDEFKKRLKEIK